MKEIRNLAEKNECFDEIKYEDLIQEMKDQALSLLIFMVKKRMGELKLHSCIQEDVQKLYADKNKVSSPTPDFYLLKYICRVIAREARDVEIMDLSSFFL